MTKSNSRRFVNAAWSLLTFQLIASAGAVAVTGYAAFHVRTLVQDAQMAAGPVPEAVAGPAEEAPATPAPDGAAPATEAPPSDPAAPAPAAAPVNDGPGVLSLSQTPNNLLTALLSDPDGVARITQIQWLRNGRPFMSGSMSYQPSYDDSGAYISARVDYVDNDGFTETAASASVPIPVIVQ